MARPRTALPTPCLSCPTWPGSPGLTVASVVGGLASSRLLRTAAAQLPQASVCRGPWSALGLWQQEVPTVRGPHQQPQWSASPLEQESPGTSPARLLRLLGLPPPS